MDTEDIITITVTLKNGQCFEHHPSPRTKDKQTQFLTDIINELKKRRSGILTLSHPIGIYRLDDVSSIHIQDESISEVPPMGFRIDKTIDKQEDQ